MNEWVGIGRLTKNPELAYTKNDTAKCTFSIAVDRPRRSGEEQGADFIRIIAWGRQAENCDRYLSKGSQCAVKGSIRTGSYKNRDGATVYTTDVWAENVEFLSTGQRDKQSEYSASQSFNRSSNTINPYEEKQPLQE